jgi:hypothetical protein
MWLLLNLAQAGSTGLMDDEAYYWVYSRFPDWGYFDHPPVIALMIRAGYAFFPSELGVRLLVVLTGTGTLMAIDSLLSRRDDHLFYAIALGMAVLQIGGILAVPDMPLLFFVAMFFLSYRAFLRVPGIRQALLLGIVMALMLYSKYHGVLVICCTLLADITLLKRGKAWLAALVALLLFAPHLYWQYTHDFPSVRYHLFERNAGGYRFAYTWEFLAGQVLLAGPLLGWLLLWAAGRHKPADRLEKALQWTFFGVYGLFFLSTFRGRAEANWTIPAWVSLIVLSHQYLSARPAAARWVYRLWLPSFVLVLLLRVYLAVDIAPPAFLKKDEFHRTREWAEAVREKAAGRPVVFVNSYQRASQYWFYSGDTAFSLNNVYYRRNNYNFWPLEARLLGRDVLLCSPDDFGFFRDSIRNSRRPIGAAVASPYYAYSQVAFAGSGELRVSGNQRQGKQVLDELQVNIPLNLREHAAFTRFDTARIYLTVYARGRYPEIVIPADVRLRDAVAGKLRVQVQIPDSIAAGRYRARWGIGNPVPGWPSVNSSGLSLVVD